MKTVMVIDDDWSRYRDLSVLPIRIVWARTPAEAIEMFSLHPDPDIVLWDHELVQVVGNFVAQVGDTEHVARTVSEQLLSSPEMAVHSWSPTGAQNLVETLSKRFQVSAIPFGPKLMEWLESRCDR